MLVLLLFFLSGATALVYEVIWSKYLSLMFGSTVQAQTVVLAVFMGGLALGNRIFGKRSAQWPQPLAIYGYVELAIGLYAFFFHSLYQLADSLFISVGSKFLENPGTLLAIKGFLAVGLLIIPTVLMGGTLPLLATWLERRVADAGRSSARFYSTNSLGAVFGSAVGGFYLVRSWGMLSSLQLAAFVNLIVALAAIAISRQSGDLAPREKTSGPTNEVLPPKAALALVMVTGGVSMGLEVLSSRAVALIVGGSLQAFAIVLMAFILGIGAGAGIVASPRFSKWQTQKTMFGLLLSASLVILLFVFRVEDWAILYSSGKLALAPNENGFVLNQILVAIIAILALGVPAALLGAVLPMAIRAGADNGGSLGDQVGRLLTWNTLGAVIGVLLTGFVLMPYAGLRGSFLILALALAVIGTVGAHRNASSMLSYVGYVAIAGVLILFGSGADNWRHVVGSGLFRMRGIQLTRDSIELRKREVKIEYYKDAADATVAVETGETEDGSPQMILRVNGKADASTHGDLATQYLVGHLPIMMRPESKDVFLLGYGSGITAGAVLGHTNVDLVVAENCAPVLEGAEYFKKWNRDALKNPRAHLRREDARTVLKLSNKKYDVIICEPSNPWVASNGSVFSREFYELCASRLAEGGMMAQWCHIYEMHDGIVELVIRTFTSVFPYVELWEPANGDLILLASMKPWKSTPEVLAKSFERPLVRADMEEINLPTPASVFARQVASQRTAFAITGEGPTQSDEFPVLEYAAPQAFFIGQHARRLFQLDERTRQSAFAPEANRAALSSISEADLRKIFSVYTTANEELERYLRWRSARVEEGKPHPIYDHDPALPVIFRPSSSYVPANDPKVDKTLTDAELNIVAQSQLTASSLKAIEDALIKEAAEPKKKRQWRPAHFATVGARATLAAGQLDRAATFIDLGQKFAPADIELAYLKRILDAAKPKPPTNR